MKSNQVCISKFFCIDIYLLIGLLVLGLIFSIYSKNILGKEVAQKVYYLKADEKDSHKKNYYDKIYDVLKAPYNTYQSEYPSVHTQGDALPDFQQLGMVYRDESDPNYKPEQEQRFSLYGRPRYTGSNKYEYYVMTGGIKVMIGSDINELMTGDTIQVTGYTGDFKVEVYETLGPRYNPWSY